MQAFLCGTEWTTDEYKANNSIGIPLGVAPVSYEYNDSLKCFTCMRTNFVDPHYTMFKFVYICFLPPYTALPEPVIPCLQMDYPVSNLPSDHVDYNAFFQICELVCFIFTLCLFVVYRSASTPLWISI